MTIDDDFNPTLDAMMRAAVAVGPYAPDARFHIRRSAYDEIAIQTREAFAWREADEVESHGAPSRERLLMGHFVHIIPDAMWQGDEAWGLDFAGCERKNGASRPPTTYRYSIWRPNSGYIGDHDIFADDVVHLDGPPRAEFWCGGEFVGSTPLSGDVIIRRY